MDAQLSRMLDGERYRDYESHVDIGSDSFLDYGAITLDCATISIGDDVSIGNDVWQGDDTVIGAGSVVTRYVPARVFAAGNRCRVISELP